MFPAAAYLGKPAWHWSERLPTLLHPYRKERATLLSAGKATLMLKVLPHIVILGTHCSTSPSRTKDSEKSEHLKADSKSTVVLPKFGADKDRDILLQNSPVGAAVIKSRLGLTT